MGSQKGTMASTADKLARALAELDPGRLQTIAADVYRQVPHQFDVAGLHRLAKRLLDEEVWDVEVVKTAQDNQLVSGLKMSAVESEIMAHQCQYVEEQFGKGIDINLGWSIEDGCITSKVYGHGILTTWYNEDGITDEEVDEFQ